MDDTPFSPYVDEYWQGAWRTDAEVQALAEQLNCDVLCGTPSTLLVDLDSMRDVQIFEQQFGQLQVLGLLTNDANYRLMRSRSGHWHAEIWMTEPINSVEYRIMLQLLLGSDIRKEAYSLAGHRAGREEPIVLYRPRTPYTEPDIADPFSF